VSQFAQISAAHLPGACPGGIGLTAALTVLRSGWVIVGSLPTSNNGTVFTSAGCLLVLNSSGKVVETFSGHTDPAALVIGPTGVGLGGSGTLYVADTAANRITAIPDATFRDESAGTGRTVTSGRALNGPLGLAIGPDEDILTVNSGDGNLVETTPRGHQEATHQLDNTGSPAGAGALFGLAVAPGEHGGVYFVDDAADTLDLVH
jgi:hypothetical protein